MAITRGAADFLDVTSERSSGFKVLREFLIQQGDRAVHFSGHCCELTATPVTDSAQRKLLSWTPLHRTAVVTSHALMYIPRTTEESGIFFDCRVPLDTIAQVVVLDTEEYGFVVQIFTKTTDARTSVSIASPFPNMKFAGQLLRATLTFRDASLRKSLLMTMCVVRPQLPIMQRKRTDGGSASEGPSSPARTLKTYDSFMSPGAASPAARGVRSPDTSFRSPAPKTPAGNLSHIPTFSYAPSAGPAHTDAAADPADLSVADYEGGKSLLREDLLRAGEMDQDDFYDAERAASRPVEEDPTRGEEREAVRAMLEARERKMFQNINFRMKYPVKAPTQVEPGVEYDKAHEEHLALKDDYSDLDLLGPSLMPLWLRWREAGGLQGLGLQGFEGEDVEESPQWSIYDSNDLVASLKVLENKIYGRVGAMSMARVVRMREMVERELQMFQNKRSFRRRQERKDRGELEGTTRPARTIKVRPFSLSQSPVTLRKLKLIHADALIREMKQSSEVHQLAIHDIRKQQLQREVRRAEGE